MKKYFLLGLVFLLVMGLSLGCAPAERVDPDNNNDGTRNDNLIPNDQDNPNYQNDPYDVDTPGDNTTIPRNNDTENNNDAPGDDEARARRVADLATEIDGVDNATVVVTGETAYVGIDMDANAESDETNRLKKKVGDQIKEEEATIDRVFVSADVDTVTRLRKMGRDIRGGRPISGFLDELTEMFRRPTPTME